MYHGTDDPLLALTNPGLLVRSAEGNILKLLAPIAVTLAVLYYIFVVEGQRRSMAALDEEELREQDADEGDGADSGEENTNPDHED